MLIKPGSLLTQASVYLLLVSAVNLGFGIRRSFVQSKQVTTTAYPPIALGTLQGVNYDGKVVRPKLKSLQEDNHPNRLIVFPIRSATSSQDIQFWNKVVQIIDQSAPPGTIGAYEYLGVCDRGEACRDVAASAKFELVGYLAPRDMRMVAVAAQNGLVLICDKSHTPRSVKLSSSSAEESSLIIAVR